MTNEEMVQFYLSARHQARSYTGSDPERQRMLDEAVDAWAQELRKRGLNPADYHKNDNEPRKPRVQ